MIRKKLTVLVAIGLVGIIASLPCTADSQHVTNGARAIFESGEGTSSVRTSAGQPVPAASTPALEAYAGISYRIALLKTDGSFTVIHRARTFRTGERIKILVRTNRPGYLAVLSVDSAGKTAVLFHEPVEARQLCEIPRSRALMFSGPPGTENILIMLSRNPNPMAGEHVATGASGPGTTSTSQPPLLGPSLPASPASIGLPPQESLSAHPGPAMKAGGNPSPPQPERVARNMRVSRDIAADRVGTGYAVISPGTEWDPSAKGVRDIIVETDPKDGSHYAVVPDAALDEGGIFTLGLKLKHR